MMLNITKLQKKGCLAKEMIRLGVSDDIGQALSQIEDHNLVDSNDGFNVSKTVEPKKKEEVKAEEPDHITKRMDKIEMKLNQITDFIQKYREQNDTNLREVDSCLKSVQKGLNELRSAKIEAPKIEEEKPAQETLTVEETTVEESESPDAPEKKEKFKEFTEVKKPEEEWNSDDFAVEKIFNNSNGQMMGRAK